MEKEIKILGATEKIPFTIVKCEVDGKEKHFVACGKIRSKIMYENYEDAEQAIENKEWDLICLLLEQFTTFIINKNK